MNKWNLTKLSSPLALALISHQHRDQPPSTTFSVRFSAEQDMRVHLRLRTHLCIYIILSYFILFSWLIAVIIRLATVTTVKCSQETIIIIFMYSILQTDYIISQILKFDLTVRATEFSKENMPDSMTVFILIKINKLLIIIGYYLTY